MIFQILGLLILSAIIYSGIVAMFRAYLGPLSKIPGPKLAAFTQGYEMYYDLLQNARFPWQIKALHDAYGTEPLDLF